jgi:hypothetical protein
MNKPLSKIKSKVKLRIQLRLSKSFWNRVKGYRARWEISQSTTYQQIYHCNDFSLKSCLETLPRNIERPPKEYNQMKQLCKPVDMKNSVWYDREGKKIVQYLVEFIPRDLASELEEQLRQLVKVSCPQLSSLNNGAVIQTTPTNRSETPTPALS